MVIPKQGIALMKATVRRERVVIWTGLNVVFTIAGLLQIWLQRRSSRPVIIDTAAVALTTDVTPLLQDPWVESLRWRNMSYLTKEDVYGDGPIPHRMWLKLDRYKDGFALAKKGG
ncbi:hypothetical protein FPQ18DRAFT_301402 [Pyronema domesticum]|nr:hypothetical protein FPQ18DRAFT_301402 [Pyronema domesticum]